MRQFISSAMPCNGVVTAAGDDYRHLRRVLRVRVGDMIDVRLSGGKLMKATVCQIDDNLGIVKMALLPQTFLPQTDGSSQASGANSVTHVGGETSDNGGGEGYPDVILLQFVARPQKMEQIVRQAVECAVDTVIPVAGEYSQAGYVKTLLDGPTARMQRIIKEAMEQSGSPRPLRVTKAMSVEEAIKWWQMGRCLLSGYSPNREGETKEEDSKEEGAWAAFVLSERDAPRPYDVISECRNIKKVAIAVGSEGGIALDEEAALNAAGFVSIHIGGNILRCETAAIYGVATVREIAEGLG